MRAIAARLPEGRDLLIAGLLAGIVGLMILPMPTVLVDALIGLNFGVAFLLLMTAVYLVTPLALSSLPGIILIATTFRLALSISTTRLILAEGDAGRIVETFGRVVIAGNVVVGLVIFFIVTIVQFVVIAKGSERIAEVSARFTLDALPGKQMAIDAELRSGDLTNAEAAERRSVLERENQFFGAMDGAMKFVKGDAIAGIVIILINLVGGLLIGITQFGMTFAEASRRFVLLTVGDALISQIPALLVSITAAVIVTRVKGDGPRNLGADIFGQIGADPRATGIAAVGLAGLALIPGFPTATLLLLAGCFAAGSVLMHRGKAAATPDAPPEADAGSERGAVPDPLAPDDDTRAILELSPALFEALGPTRAAEGLVEMAAQVGDATGVAPCTMGLRPVDGLEDAQFRVLIDGAPHVWGTVRAAHLYAADMPTVLEVHDIPFEPRKVGPWRRDLEVPEIHGPRLSELGVPHSDMPLTLFADAARGVVAHYPMLIGIQEAKNVLARVEADYPFLVGECARLVPLPKLANVFRRLLDEGVSLSNVRKILETLVEWAAAEKDPLVLAEHCRVALRQQLCQQVADRSRVISTIVIERASEELLRAGLRGTDQGTFLVLAENMSAELLRVVNAQISQLDPIEARPVILTSMDVRRHVKAFLNRNLVEIDVLSFQELSDDYTVVPCATVRLGEAAARDGRMPLREQTALAVTTSERAA
ncbi:type III secretion system export apparatus subunit SctV [Jannaschia sp. LMIT008]|uniref:type III secretion system export apparatus subunit SctV n=1 Tax=Jannaschia maritima TaxID=3032585 RepID=UPI002810B0A3|nr:type III secretion system export apparatus subunit SctV [Jannaschia sp. LMIT008]